MTGVIGPSYRSGFASPQRNRNRLKHPHLWRDCKFAAAMCLGATGTRLYDQSGYGRNGTLTNMTPATDWVANGSGMALDFDGTDDYVSIPLSVYIPAPLTMTCWVNFRSVAAFQGVFSYGDNSGFYAGRTVGVSSAGKAWANESDSTGEQNTLGSTTIATGVWVHLAAVFPAGGSFAISLNGTQENSNSVRKTPATAQAVCIGTRVFNGIPQISFANALVDDVRLYNTALSQSVISQLALRRGIAYEMTRSRTRKAATATSNRNKMMMGCGF